MKTSLAERFWSKVDKSGDCWLWTGATWKNGYGAFHVNRRVTTAHRIAWELTNGPIPEGKGHHGTCVCHTCDVRNCVRPDHLFLASQAENLQDCVRKGRTNRAVGEQNGRTELCELDVWLIRNIEGQTDQAISDFLDIPRSTINCIRNRRTWRHL